MTYRLNTDRLVFFSVLLWVLLPPGVFAWEGNPPGPDNVRLKISVLFVMSILCLVLYGGSLSFAVFYLPLALINPAVYCFSVGRAE